jgi:hypothetical protein
VSAYDSPYLAIIHIFDYLGAIKPLWAYQKKGLGFINSENNAIDYSQKGFLSILHRTK